MPITLSGVYANNFARAANIMCSPSNIQQIANRFAALEKAKSYSFGDFAKLLLPNRIDWGAGSAFDDWEKNVGDIPAALRQALTDVIRDNFRSVPPLPMLLKVGDNVDQTHDLVIKYFAVNGIDYIGILMLCPNPDPPPP